MKHYQENITTDIKQIKVHCPICGRSLWHHGKFERNVVTEQVIMLRIWIFRLYCPDCKMTFSLLPSFLKPRSCMLMALFEEIIFSKVILKKTYAEVVQEFLSRIPGGVCSKTLHRYIKKTREACKDIIIRLESFLCSYLPEKQLPVCPITDHADRFINRVFLLADSFNQVFKKYYQVQLLKSYTYFSNLNEYLMKAFVL